MPAPADSWVLWGSHPLYADGEPIKLTGGTLRECATAQCERERESSDWLLATYRAGAAPLGLRIQAAARTRAWCEVDECIAHAEPCKCGAAHCENHPHLERAS
jgi:hypothetical protein